MITYTVEVYPAGTKRWYLNGNRHRVDGPAVEYADGDKYWYLNGQRHRVDGPAAEYATGTKYWYLNYQLHRVDGPAIEYADGSKEWYLNDQCLTEDEYNEQMNPVKEYSVAGILRRFLAIASR